MNRQLITYNPLPPVQTNPATSNLLFLRQFRPLPLYGRDKYRRLVALKNKYDPENIFRLNQNIMPTVTASRILKNLSA